LPDIATKFTDGPFGSNLKSSHYTKDGVRVLRLQNIGVGEMLHDDLAFISREHYESLPRNHCRPGDVIIATLGDPNLRACVVPGDLSESLNKADCLLLRVDQTLAYPDYVCAVLNDDRTVAAAAAFIRGQTRGRISLGRLKQLQIPLPPLDEQRRIVDILDAANSLRAKRRESLAQLDTLLQSTFLDMFGDPVTNPMGWESVLLSDVGDYISGGTPSKARGDYWVGPIPWVSPKDMKVSQIFDSQDHVSELVFDETNLKLVEPNHLLIVVRGMILAHSFPVAINRVPVAINQDMKAIAASSEFNVEFLMQCVRHLKRQLLSEVSTAGHGTKRFDRKAMKKIRVPRPPLAIQQRFATIAQSLVQQKARQRTHLAELDTLFASLQSRAFRGEL
jgi:hypothetical protein